MSSNLRALVQRSALKHRLWIIGISLLLLHALVAAAVVHNSASYPLLMGWILLAYGLGLRHAVDADHIAAIDNTTRKLMHDGQKPAAVGFFFGLGHSAIVVAMYGVVSWSTSFLSTSFPAFKETGVLIGTTVSCSFLLIIGTINLVVLVGIIKTWREILAGRAPTNQTLEELLNNRGLLTRIIKPLLKLVSQSWHMFAIGLLFGVGFDTASEVALLSISASTGIAAMPLHVQLLIPLAFAAGMTLIDTLDGILMLGAYGWAFLNPIRKLYYNMNITLISVVIAIFIGGIEGLQVISTIAGYTGGIWDFANNLQIDAWGYYIIALFAFCWLISMLVYRWRRYDDRLTGQAES